MTLYEKIKNMSVTEMAEFLDEVSEAGRRCGEADNCDECSVKDCQLASYKVKLMWDII